MAGDYKVRHFVVSDCISFFRFRVTSTLIQNQIEETNRHLGTKIGYVREALVLDSQTAS
jgi:hypothetical protein